MSYKIYFAGSIRGGRDDKELYFKLIVHLQQHGTILTEHVGAETLTALGENKRDDAEIYQRDMAWIDEADVIIAEVSTPSLGVGYEIGKTEGKKPMLCLYRAQQNKSLSAMIGGNSHLRIARYTTVEEAKEHIDHFMGTLK